MIPVFLVNIGKCGNIKCQFHGPIKAVRVLKRLGDHPLERLAWEKDDAHIAKHHFDIWLYAVPISGKAEGLRVEINRRPIVAGKEPDRPS